MAARSTRSSPLCACGTSALAAETCSECDCLVTTDHAYSCEGCGALYHACGDCAWLSSLRNCDVCDAVCCERCDGLPVCGRCGIFVHCLGDTCACDPMARQGSWNTLFGDQADHLGDEPYDDWWREQIAPTSIHGTHDEWIEAFRHRAIIYKVLCELDMLDENHECTWTGGEQQDRFEVAIEKETEGESTVDFSGLIGTVLANPKARN